MREIPGHQTNVSLCHSSVAGEYMEGGREGEGEKERERERERERVSE